MPTRAFHDGVSAKVLIGDVPKDSRPDSRREHKVVFRVYEQIDVADTSSGTPRGKPIRHLLPLSHRRPGIYDIGNDAVIRRLFEKCKLTRTPASVNHDRAVCGQIC